MMEEEEDVESDQSEVIDPDMGDEEQAKEEKLSKWKEHSWAKHNLEDPDIPFVEDDEWLPIRFENRKKEKERVIMMRRHARFEPAQIVVPINRPKIPTPPIVWETINLVEKVEEFQMQPWINPNDECDYSRWIEEREDLDFICPDPYKTGESDFDEMEGERNDPLDGTSLASLFNQMEITNNEEDEEVIKAQTNTSIWGLLMSQRDSHRASFKDEFSSEALFGKEEGGKEYKIAKDKAKEGNPKMLH
ncbi:hypothetical protein RHMOL_Rhmol10G0204200 [Rhododendron molle]|uniref:Uncharacterized protein n=1 Tax=Rhododendron molle TaxID=49168 RepID=A0ACC0M5Y5_RHOML|nr:hypothetical protein RHMOL_Rhmol10G0204200 [Rhododendron molle]